MKNCEACHSERVNKESKKLSEEDLENIINIYTCQVCGLKTTKLVNLQEVQQ